MSRVAVSAIIGRRGTSTLLSPPNPSLSLSFLLFRSLSHACGSPSSPSPAVMTNETESETLHRLRCNSGLSNLQDAVNLFNHLLQMRPLPSIIRINKVLGMIAKMGHYGTVLSFVGKLKVLSFQVDLYTLNIEINCYCHLNGVDFGFSLLGGLFKRAYIPNVVTFTTLINGLISEDKIAEAVELFKKLIRKGEIEPNVVTYGTIVNGLCKTGSTSTAIRLLQMMEEGSCKLNTVVYSTIIDSLCKDRMPDDALNLLLEMNEKGIRPNVVTYNSLVHGLCNLGKQEEATRMLIEMLDSSIPLNVRTFNVLMDALAKEGMAKEAQGVLEIMIQIGVDHNIVTYNTLMDGFCL